MRLGLAVMVGLCAAPAFAQAIRVPGTQVTLAPPDGFAIAQQYPGFERADVRASIMVTELPGPASRMMKGMTTQALASRGMTLISAQSAVVNRRPARLLHVRQKTSDADALKWMLIAGDDARTIMVVGTYSQDAAPGLGEAIQQSLLTTSWAPADTPDPFEGLPFGITPTPKLKLARRVSNMLMFTESGTAGSPGSTEGVFLVGHSIGKGQIKDLQSFSEARAKQTAQLTALRGFTGSAVQVDGLDAYELEVDATDVRSGRPMRLYQVMIPDATGYFIAQGLIRADRAAEMVPEFKAVTKSFRRTGVR